MTWLYIPSKFAPEWECLEKDCELGSDTWASRLAPVVSWNGKPTRPASLLLALKKAAWSLRLCGPIYSPSTVRRGVEQWTASLRGSRAKTSAWRDGVLASMESVQACSSTSSTLPTIAVRGSSFWRTSAGSLLPPPPLWTKPKGLSKNERPPASWENWPTEGGMRNGSLFQRPTWVPAMGAHVGSVSLGADMWATPAAADAKRSGNFGRGEGNPTFSGQARQWMTPTTQSAKGVDYQRVKGKNVLILDGQAKALMEQWPTPMAQDAEQSGSAKAGMLTLHRASQNWPTPAARDSKGANSEEHCTVTGGGEKAHGPVEQLRGPFFAPGPADPAWRDILASRPWLAPALSIEEQHDAQVAFAAAQSNVRGAPDGVAARLDFDARAQRLKCIGNGVVALQAATAFVVLARRAGLKVAPL